MIRKSLYALAGIGLVGAMAAGDARADFVNFNELTNAGTIGKFANNTSVSTGGLTATSGQIGGGDTGLTVANFGSEVGLGVCGTGDFGSNTLCDSNEAVGVNKDPSGLWDGQLDEIDNQDGSSTAGFSEFITISEDTATLTGKFKLGSFDGNSGNSIGTTESGYVTYNGGADTVTFNWFGGILVGDADLDLISGNIWLLTLNDYDSSLGNSVTFFAGCGVGASGCGTDNDYLVAAADVAVVPIPAALPLFLSALGGLGLIGWRRKGARTA